MAPTDPAPKPITHAFDYLGRDIALGEQDAITWKGADGVTIEGLVTYPVGYKAGEKYPLAVMTHGGPQASDKYGVGSMSYEIQVLAGKGYVCLQPNYRGSTGYGDAFLRDMVGQLQHDTGELALFLELETLPAPVPVAPHRPRADRALAMTTV